VLIDTDHTHAVEAGRVVDQDPLAFGQDGVVGGVPRHCQGGGDPGHAQVPDYDRLQRPAQRAAGQLRAWMRGLGGVLAPHVPAAGTPVAAHDHLQDGGSPTHRLVREATHHAVTGGAFAAAASTPTVRLHDPAGQYRPVRLQVLPNDLQAELVQAREGG
jgi:hypothetical protein